MPGYDCEFVDTLKRKFVCSLCHLAMRDAVQITTCGHRFCDTCLQEYLSEGIFTCPEDRLPLDYAKIYPDPEAERNVMGSVVFCIHHKDGCNWNDELRKLKAHLNTCKYDAIPCTNHCAAMIPRILMEDHLTYTCPKRRIKCEFCNKEFSGEMLEGHTGSCLYEPLYCESKCGSKLQRRFMTNHRLNECSKRLVPCRFCQKEFVYDTLQVHQGKCPRYLMPCPNRCDPVKKVAREDLDSHLNDQCPAVVVACPFKEIGCPFKGGRAMVEKHQEECSQQHLSMVCGVVSKQQQMILSLKTALQSLSVNHNGTLLWRIPDVSARLAEARATPTSDSHEIRSIPFYTSTHGYKLMATLFLNGNGAGEGFHVSIYIRILPGEYDALLQWPFSHTVSFTLLDQASTPEKACSIAESFVPDPTWKNFQRPSREPDALGFGFPRFVSHETLRKRHYVREDTIFIRVKVDPSKIIAV